MASRSRSQQKFFGMIHAVQEGEISPPSKEVAETAKSVDSGDAEDFASTKHEGLPEKKSWSRQAAFNLGRQMARTKSGKASLEGVDEDRDYRDWEKKFKKPVPPGYDWVDVTNDLYACTKKPRLKRAQTFANKRRSRLSKGLPQGGITGIGGKLPAPPKPPVARPPEPPRHLLPQYRNAARGPAAMGKGLQFTPSPAYRAGRAVAPAYNLGARVVPPVYRAGSRAVAPIGKAWSWAKKPFSVFARKHPLLAMGANVAAGQLLNDPITARPGQPATGNETLHGNLFGRGVARQGLNMLPHGVKKRLISRGISGEGAGTAARQLTKRIVPQAASPAFKSFAQQLALRGGRRLGGMGGLLGTMPINAGLELLDLAGGLSTGLGGTGKPGWSSNKEFTEATSPTGTVFGQRFPGSMPLSYAGAVWNAGERPMRSGYELGREISPMALSDAYDVAKGGGNPRTTLTGWGLGMPLNRARQWWNQ